jgi:hypothetical protein
MEKVGVCSEFSWRRNPDWRRPDRTQHESQTGRFIGCCVNVMESQTGVSYAVCNRHDHSFMVLRHRLNWKQYRGFYSDVNYHFRKYAVQCNIEFFFYCGNIYKDEILQKYRSKFRIRFSVVSVPSKSTIDRLVNRFRYKPSLLMQKWQQTRCVIFEETSADMKARLVASQQIFKTAVAGDKCVQVTVQAATEFLQSKPYKSRVMPNLEDAECAARQRCCNWLCRTVSIGEAYLC